MFDVFKYKCEKFELFDFFYIYRSYVAQTRGAVHTAPLPGHVQSVASQNLQPAPGTL